MNIFALHENAVLAAQMQCDKHVVKMILESAQLLSTAHRILDGKPIVKPRKHWELPDLREGILYKATHQNHPSAIWARANVQNYRWLHDHFCALMDEFTHRYGRLHKCEKLRVYLSFAPFNISSAIEPFEFSVAMKDEYKVGDTPIEMYRHYYREAKAAFAKWTNRNPPEWWYERPVEHS